MLAYFGSDCFVYTTCYKTEAKSIRSGGGTKRNTTVMGGYFVLIVVIKIQPGLRSPGEIKFSKLNLKKLKTAWDLKLAKAQHKILSLLFIPRFIRAQWKNTMV